MAHNKLANFAFKAPTWLRRTNIALGAVLLLIILWMATGGLRDRLRFYRFDSASWKETARAQRYFMAKYVLDRALISGKTRWEVVALLGDPDSDSGSEIHYCLGPEHQSFIRIDDDWLSIQFDGGGLDSKALYTEIHPD